MKLCKLILVLFLVSVILLCTMGCSEKETTEWVPDFSRPWLFTPVVGEFDPEEYDIEFNIEFPTYPASVSEIKVTALNKTGKTFDIQSNGLFIEKLYLNSFPDYESEPGWVRLPYYSGEGMYRHSWTARADYTFTFRTKYLQENCKLTPGQYRFVIFLGDGPHYVYFEITG